MTVEFNHTIVWSRDAKASARFLAGILGLPEPSKVYHFEVVTTANGVSVDFADTEDEIRTQHYAFLVSEEEFQPHPGSRPGLLGRSHTHQAGRDQPSRQRARRLFPGPQWPSPGDHHAAIRQRWQVALSEP
jgi:hypothetical protein